METSTVNGHKNMNTIKNMVQNMSDNKNFDFMYFFANSHLVWCNI